MTFTPTHYRVSGELRFDSMEHSDMADGIGLRINGDLEFTDPDLEDITWETNWKQYTIWVDAKLVEENDLKLTIEPYPLDPETLMLFKPA